MQFMYNKKNLCLNINVIDGWLVWLMVFSATFNNISVYRGGQFYCWRKLEDPEKTTVMSQVSDKLYHKKLYRVHFPLAGFQFKTLMLLCTDCIASCRSNYHEIKIPTLPSFSQVYKF
jgi:hypothetical protein